MLEALFIIVVYLVCGLGSLDIFKEVYSKYIINCRKSVRILMRVSSILCWPVFGVVYILHAVVFIVVVLILAIPDVVKDLVEDISK